MGLVYLPMTWEMPIWTPFISKARISSLFSTTLRWWARIWTLTSAQLVWSTWDTVEPPDIGLSIGIIRGEMEDQWRSQIFDTFWNQAGHWKVDKTQIFALVNVCPADCEGLTSWIISGKEAKCTICGKRKCSASSNQYASLVGWSNPGCNPTYNHMYVRRDTEIHIHILICACKCVYIICTYTDDDDDDVDAFVRTYISYAV